MQLDRVTAGLLSYNAVVNANTILFVSFLPLLAQDRGLTILQGGLLIAEVSAHRHFRTDRIEAIEFLSERYPMTAAALHAAWRAEERGRPLEAE